MTIPGFSNFMDTLVSGIRAEGLKIQCDKCKAAPGEHCRTASGKKATDLHYPRIQAGRSAYYQNNAAAVLNIRGNARETETPGRVSE